MAGMEGGELSTTCGAGRRTKGPSLSEREKIRHSPALRKEKHVGGSIKKGKFK